MRSTIIALCSLTTLVPPTHARDLNQPHPQPDPGAASVLGQGDAWSPARLSLRDITIYWENDGTYPNFVGDTDRYYTNGLGVEISLNPNLTEDLKDKLAPAGEWDNPRFGLGFAIKQMIFTSKEITDPNPPMDDHPYSGYLYLALSAQRADDHKHDHFELDIGVVGERSQAEAVQRFIHNAFPDEFEPQGWDHQLANEVGVNFTYERTWKTQTGDARGLKLEMLPSLGFDVGNVSVRARAKMTLRAGLNLPSDFGPATLLGHKDHTIDATSWGEGDFSFYVYGSLGVDAVAHSIFLDGNTFSGSRSADSEPFVATWSLGAVVRYKAVYLGWAQNFQSETFEAQDGQQTWGTIALGASFGF